LRRGQHLAKNRFVGEIAEDNLFPYPQINARDGERLGAMVDAIDGFLADKQADLKHWDREAHQPEEFIQGLRDMGLFGLIIPEEHGGLGLSNAAYARVLSQTSRHDSSVSLTIGAHSSIGMKGVLLFGTPEQKARYLPLLASGELIAAFCLTESGAGSDAASIRTRATRNDDSSGCAMAHDFGAISPTTMCRNTTIDNPKVKPITCWAVDEREKALPRMPSMIPAMAGSAVLTKGNKTSNIVPRGW
jgi:alkylation response protein AidB-like acyl-CoA dehydrogenase